MESENELDFIRLITIPLKRRKNIRGGDNDV